MENKVALIGFGEAAMAFAGPWAERGVGASAYDIKTDDPAQAAAKREDYDRFGVRGADDLSGAVRDADIIISVVTADQALDVAHGAAAHLKRGSLYCDFNSAAPRTKRLAAQKVEAAGGLYTDVAVLSPVIPARLAVPLLVSGPHGAAAAAALEGLGFSPRVVGGRVGDAVTVKMLRSIIVKGLEALTTECFVAAQAAGVSEEVAASLADAWPGVDWLARADYNLERMITHGTRRAAEMEEVAATLDSLGCDSMMARSAAGAQRRIGSVGPAAPESFAAKADLVRAALGKAA